MAKLSNDPLVIAIDGSIAGRGCIVLMASIIFGRRALPVAWIVVKGKKGHLPEDLHIRLMSQLQGVAPVGARVVILGDGEFDGIRLQKAIADSGWEYSCRTGKNITLFWEGYEFPCEEIGRHLEQGTTIEVYNCLFTKDKYGPVMVVGWWRKDCKEPIYLVTNMVSANDACDKYALRFRIETFFSDQKTRGFQIHRSHLSDPERLSRLLIAACLAYIWVVYLGVWCRDNGKVGLINRVNRCDLSLFQVGLRWLEHLLNEGRKLSMPLHQALA